MRRWLGQLRCLLLDRHRWMTLSHRFGSRDDPENIDIIREHVRCEFCGEERHWEYCPWPNQATVMKP